MGRQPFLKTWIGPACSPDQTPARPEAPSGATAAPSDSLRSFASSASLKLIPWLLVRRGLLKYLRQEGCRVRDNLPATQEISGHGLEEFQDSVLI